MNRVRRRPWGLLLMLVGLWATGCSDNPADTVITCDHIDADGLVVEHAPDGALASQWLGTVTGEIDVEEGESRDGLEVVFIRADSTRITVDPSCTDHRLEWIIDNEDVATATRASTWSINLMGVEEGVTTVRFQIFHGDHADFTSQPIEVHVEHHDEVEIDGFDLNLGATTVASQRQGVVTGSVAASVGVASGPFDLVWIGADSAAVSPEEGARLVVEVLDTAVARVDTVAGMPWQFTVTGLTAGSTSITVKLEHEGHFDFESQPIPLTVTTAVSPQAFWVKDSCNPVAFWNFDPANGPNQTHGGLIVEPGSTRSNLRAYALGDELPSGRVELALDGSYSLEWEIQNTAIATLSPGGDAFSMNLQGVQAGHTTVTFRVLRHGGAVYATGSMNIWVAAKPAPTAAPDFTLKKDGVWTVINRAGTLLNADCGRAPGPGKLTTAVSTETSLYWIKLLNNCSESNPLSSYTFLFEFEDPCIASIVNHPIHWGERTQFHVRGEGAGQTNLTIYAVRNNVLEYVTPPLPVEITP